MRDLTIIISFLFISTITQGQKTYLDSSVYGNGQLESKGLYYQIGNQSWQWGIWEYWYEDGKKQLELWSDTIKTRYVNMWLPDGTQILKSGKGYYYSIEPQSELSDSNVYEIKDSIKNGFYKSYRSYKDNPYFLVETGLYENEQKTGVWHFRDTILKINLFRTYKNDRQNGLKIRYYPNGQIKDSVTYLDDKENGNCKAYTENGILIKDCSYKNGRLIGDFKEYFPNGKIKVEGQYIQVKGYEKVNMVNIETFRVRTANHFTNDKPLKQGTWKFYNQNGLIIRIEKYINGKKV